MYNIRHFHIITTGEGGGGENRRLQHVQNDKVSKRGGGGASYSPRTNLLLLKIYLPMTVYLLIYQNEDHAQ